MKINKLAPWNWFNREEEDEGKMMPARRADIQRNLSHPFLQLHDQIDRLFDDVFRGFGFPNMDLERELVPFSRSEWFRPTLDIAETDTEYSITVELPGVDEKNIELGLNGDVLNIKGEKKQETDKKEKDFHRIERSYGSFQRVLTLPEDADKDGIKAEYKNGIMTIVIPRIASLKPESKKIEIKTN